MNKNETFLFKNKKLYEKVDIIPVFCLIKVIPKYELEVYKTLKKMRAIQEIYPLLGEYDFLIKIFFKAPLDNLEMCKYITDKIQSINGVEKTNTLSQIKV